MTATAPPTVAAPAGVPRLLAGPDGCEALAAHSARLGPIPSVGRRGISGDHLIDLVESSGLHGRGGSAFPTTTKLRAVQSGHGPRVVVANGSEGEPASAKDSSLLSSRPHLVLDGIALASHAVDARDAIVAVDRSDLTARRAIEDTLEERRAARLDEVPVRVVDVPSRYVAGEESALVHWLNGGEAKPTFVPPRPYQRGVRGRPTLVQNVETLAHVALIARFGPDWYRSMGAVDEPGTAVVTLGGAVARPGVYEIEVGTTIGALVEAAGGPTAEVGAFLTGGYFGTWIAAGSAQDLPLGHLSLSRAGGAFGCGVVHALPDGVCGLAETARVARYLAEESAGQCGPCVHGLGAIADALEGIAAGRQVEHLTGLVRRWTKQVAGRGACHLPDGAIRFVATALDVFGPELARHAERGACAPSHRRGTLPIPAPSERETGWR